MGFKDIIDYELVVIENFAGYVKGEIITDTGKVAEILASEWELHVVKTVPAPKAE